MAQSETLTPERRRELLSMTALGKAALAAEDERRREYAASAEFRQRVEAAMAIHCPGLERGPQNTPAEIWRCLWRHDRATAIHAMARKISRRPDFNVEIFPGPFSAMVLETINDVAPGQPS
jgi:hypothetical protein